MRPVAPQLAGVCADVHNERQRTHRWSHCTTVECLRYKHCVVPSQPSRHEPESTMVRLIQEVTESLRVDTSWAGRGLEGGITVSAVDARHIHWWPQWPMQSWRVNNKRHRERQRSCGRGSWRGTRSRRDEGSRGRAPHIPHTRTPRTLPPVPVSGIDARRIHRWPQWPKRSWRAERITQTARQRVVEGYQKASR